MNAANRKNVPGGNQQGQAVMNQEGQGYLNAAMATAGNHGLGYTTVPMGWNRTIWGDGSIVYVSPSGHLLHCADELQRYLLAEGTCKCGLECPLIIDRVFNFNPRVPARPKLPSDILQRSHLNTLCKHRHKLVAMAAGLQGNEESLANIGPSGGGLAAPGRSKGVKRSRSKSKPETGIDFQYPNLSVSQILALQGRHQHHPQNITKLMPSLDSIPFDHRLQQHSIESHQRHIQMRFLHMQHQELMQQHQLLLHHQQLPHQASPRRGSQESLHSPIDQCSVEVWDGRVLHSSPTLRCPNIPFTRGGEVASQSAPTAASPHNTVSTSRKRSGSSSELTVSPNERQSLHSHSSFSFPFHGEVHGPVVDGQNMVGMHLDGCSPNVIPLLSNMYHSQNRASSTAANMSNNPALFANRSDAASFMQDRSKKSLVVVPGQDSEEAAQSESSKSVEKSKGDKITTSDTSKDSNLAHSINKSSSMHNKKTDPKLPVGNISLQEIFNQSLEGSAFPASSLLSAAAKAQLAKQSQSPESPAPHHAGDLMSGMGLFNDSVTQDSSKPELASSQTSAKRKQSVESLKLSDSVGATETSSESSTAAVENISQSPIQCLENAVLNLEDQPNVVNAGSLPEGTTVSPERKRMNTKSIDDAIDDWTKRPRLHSSDSSHGCASVESETIQSEVAISTHKVPEMSMDRHFPMLQHDSTKVTGSYNVVCSTGKSTTSGEHPAVDISELARLKQQQEWCAAMLRANQQHGTGNITLEHFPTEPHMGPPHIRSRGLQELQHIAMGGGPFPRIPAMQQHPNYAQMHPFPNRFVNPQFIHPKVNMMQHPHAISRPFRMDTPVDQLDPKIPQGANVCNSNILQSMLQQQQQHLQQLGIHPPGNFHHPSMKPAYHGDPSLPMKQFPDVANLTKTHQHGSSTHKAGASSQRRKTAKVSKSSGGSSTSGTPVVDLDDEEPKDAAYWVKAASKLGGVKKVKDILAMTRSLKKHNSESGQVEAIFEAVLDSASGGMKVIIKEGTRAQQGSTDQGKGSALNKTLAKEAIPTAETSEVSSVINVTRVSADPSEQDKSGNSSPNTELNTVAGHERETSKEYLQTTFISGSQFEESEETKAAANTLLDLGSSNANYLDSQDREVMTMIEEKSVLELSSAPQAEEVPMDTKPEEGATLESDSSSPVLELPELTEVQIIRSPHDEIVDGHHDEVCNTVPEQTVFLSVEHELVACDSAGLETLPNQPAVELNVSQQTPTENLSLTGSFDTSQSPNVCANNQKSSEVAQNEEDNTVTDSGQGQLHVDYEEDTDEIEVSSQTRSSEEANSKQIEVSSQTRSSEEANSKSQEQGFTTNKTIPNTSGSTTHDSSSSENVDRDCASDSCTEHQETLLYVTDADSKEEDPEQNSKGKVPESTEEPRLSSETGDHSKVVDSCSGEGSSQGEDSHMSSGNLSLHISTAEFPDAELQQGDVGAWCSEEGGASLHESDHTSDQEDTVLVIALGECSDETGGLIEHTEPKTSGCSGTAEIIMEDQTKSSERVYIENTEQDQQHTHKISETATDTLPIESAPVKQYQSKDIQSLREGEMMDSEPGNNFQSTDEDETVDRTLVEQDQSVKCESVHLDRPLVCEPLERDESLECEPVKQDQTVVCESVEQDQSSECEPVKPDQAMDCEPVKQDQLSECEPVKQDQLLECEPVKQNQSVDCERVRQDLSEECEPVNQDQSAECEPVKHDQWMECEPIKQDQSVGCKPVKQDQSMDCEPVKQDQSMDCEPVEQDQSSDCAPVKQDQLSECEPVKQDQSPDCAPMKLDQLLECEPVKQDESLECEPVKQDQSPECEPVKQDQTLECEPVKQDHSPECEPAKQDQSLECDPWNQDKPLELDQAMKFEPVKQDLVMECEPVLRDQAAKSEPVEQDQSFNSEAVAQDQSLEYEPVLQDQASKIEHVFQDEGYEPVYKDPLISSNDEVLTVDQMSESDSVSEVELMERDLLETDQPVECEPMTQDCTMSREQLNLTQDLEQAGEVNTSVTSVQGEPMDREPAVKEDLRDHKQCAEDYENEQMDQGESLHIEEPVGDNESTCTISNSMKQDGGPVTQDRLTQSELGNQNLVICNQPGETDTNKSAENDQIQVLEDFGSKAVDQADEKSKQGDEVESVETTHPTQVPLLESVIQGTDEDEATVVESHLVEDRELTGKDTSVDIESQKDECTPGFEQVHQSQVVHCDSAEEDPLENSKTVAQDHFEETERDSSSGLVEPNRQGNLDCSEAVEQNCSRLDITEPESEDFTGHFDVSRQSNVSPQAGKMDEMLKKEQEPEVNMIEVQAMDQNESLNVNESTSENVFLTNHNIREDNVNNNRSTESLPYEENEMSSADSEFQNKSTTASNTSADVLHSDLQNDSKMNPEEKPIKEIEMDLESKAQESMNEPEIEPLETAPIVLLSTESDSGAHRSSPSPAGGDDCPQSQPTHSSEEPATDDSTLSEPSSFDNLTATSASVTMNGPSGANPDSTSEVINHCEMAEASDSGIKNPLEPFKDRSSPFEPASNRESGLPNGLVEPQCLDDIPVGSLAGQTSDNLNQEDVAGVDGQSRLDDEQENRENKPLMEEPSVQEICTARREPILKRSVGETPKSMLTAKEAGYKKERLTQEAPTRVLRGNVRTDPSTEFSSSMFPRHLEIGDLVWGPIRGYPSWPGKLVSEAEVRGRSRREEGKMWVRWFGDHSCTQVEPEKLKTLSEGLEAHHSARQSNRRGRRLNSTLEAAIQEAMNELDKKMEQAKESKMKPVPKSTRQKTRCKRLR